MHRPLSKAQYVALLITRKHFLVILASSISYLAVSLLDGAMVVGDFFLVPSAGLAVPLGILFGHPAIFGVVLGVFVGDLLTSNLSIPSLLYTLSILLLAYLSYAFYRYGVGSAIVPGGGILSSVGRFVFTAVIVCIAAAAFLAWGYELTWISSFYVSFLTSFVEYLLATLLVATPIGIVARRRRWPTYRVARDASVASAGVHRLLLVAIPPTWAVLGSVGSVGFQIRETIPLMTFRQLGVEFLYHYVNPEIFGQGGRRAQVVFGALMLLLLLASVRKHQREVTDDR